MPVGTSYKCSFLNHILNQSDQELYKMKEGGRKSNPVEKLKKHIIVFSNDECVFKSRELVTLQKYENEVKIAEEISIVFEEKKC